MLAVVYVMYVMVSWYELNPQFVNGKLIIYIILSKSRMQIANSVNFEFPAVDKTHRVTFW